MSPELSHLERYVAALSSRERALLVWHAVLTLMGLTGALLAVAALAVWVDASKAQAAAGLVLLGGVGAFLLVARPLVRRWRPAADPLRQARLVEAREPSLRGRLVTAVERTGGPVGQESESILRWMADRAWRAAQRHRPGAVHPIGPVRRAAAGAVTAWLVALAGLAMVPGGGRGAAGWWWGTEAVTGGLADGTLSAEAPAARVGDLTLRYVYPAYMGRDPYVVTNSTGEATAPPGTRVQVEARSADVVTSAALVAYDDAALEAQVVDGRRLQASFVVRPEPGTYRLVTYDGDEARSTRTFPIEVEPDLPPTVSLGEGESTLTLGVDESLGLRWTAEDDYGVARVTVEVDGRELSPDLRRPRERALELSELLRERPMDLGMQPGNTYELTVAAWDNDAVSGSKVGRSSPLRVVVLDELGRARMTAASRRELLDRVLDILADHLEEAFPPGTRGGAYASWGEQIHDRYAPLVSWLAGYRGRDGQLPDEWRTVDFALEAGRALVRYTQVSFVPRSRDAAHPDAIAAVDELRGEAVVTLEDAALQIDRLIMARAMRTLAEQTGEMADESERLAQRARATDLDPQELMLELDHLQEVFAEVEANADELAAGSLQQMVQSRARELQRIVEEARAAMGQGDTEEARELTRRTARSMESLAQAVRDELERRQEQAQQQESEAKKLLEELEALRDRQQELAVELAEVRKSEGDQRQEALQGLWERIAAQAQVVEDGLSTYDADLERAGRSFNEREYVQWALGEIEAASQAIDVRDLPGGYDATLELQRAWGAYAQRFQLIQRLEGRRGGTGPSQQDIRRRSAEIDTLLELFEQLRREDARSDASTQAEARSMAQAQRQLESDLRRTHRDAKRITQEFPVTPRGLEEALEGAASRMGQAGGDLSEGEPMQAQGSQQAAAQHVQEAIDALQQAMQQAAGAASEMEEGGEGSEDGEEQPRPDGRGDGDQPAMGSFELPEPEDFMTDEEYREELLRGMESEVPEAYRAMKRRYYEELVHQ